MSDTDRVRAWRDRLKQAGRVPMTIWVTAATKTRYEDLALTYHRSPSELAQQALDAYRPAQGSVADTVTDIEQIRTLISAEIAQLSANVTDTVTATVTETLLAQLPSLLQTTVPGCASVTVAETDTVTQPPEAVAIPHPAPGTEAATATPPLRSRRRSPEPMAAAPAAVRASEAKPPRRSGRPPSPERQQILTLLQTHPDGLSAAELRVYLQAAKPIGDTLQGMRKSGILSTREDGKTLRYVLAAAR